eukprot:scaffold15191_cov18-Tisochrysis_lutea.AAC.1
MDFAWACQGEEAHFLYLVLYMPSGISLWQGKSHVLFWRRTAGAAAHIRALCLSRLQLLSPIVMVDCCVCPATSSSFVPEASICACSVSGALPRPHWLFIGIHLAANRGTSLHAAHQCNASNCNVCGIMTSMTPSSPVLGNEASARACNLKHCTAFDRAVQSEDDCKADVTQLLTHKLRLWASEAKENVRILGEYAVINGQ